MPELLWTDPQTDSEQFEAREVLLRQLPQGLSQEQWDLGLQTESASPDVGTGDIKRGVGQVGDYREGGLSVEQIESALDAVLRRAVIKKDDAVIAAYQEVYHGRPSSNPDRLAAFRLGALLALELRRRVRIGQ